MPWRYGADVDPLRERAQIGDEDLAGREVRVLLDKVVLGEPGVLEAAAIGLLHQLHLPPHPVVLVLVVVWIPP
jgi:hypothetical protein